MSNHSIPIFSIFGRDKDKISKKSREINNENKRRDDNFASNIPIMPRQENKIKLVISTANDKNDRNPLLSLLRSKTSKETTKSQNNSRKENPVNTELDRMPILKINLSPQKNNKVTKASPSYNNRNTLDTNNINQDNTSVAKGRFHISTTEKVKDNSDGNPYGTSKPLSFLSNVKGLIIDKDVQPQKIIINTKVPPTHSQGEVTSAIPNIPIRGKGRIATPIILHSIGRQAPLDTSVKVKQELTPTKQPISEIENRLITQQLTPRNGTENQLQRNTTKKFTLHTNQKSPRVSKKLDKSRSPRFKDQVPLLSLRQSPSALYPKQHKDISPKHVEKIDTPKNKRSTNTEHHTIAYLKENNKEDGKVGIRKLFVSDSELSSDNLSVVSLSQNEEILDNKDKTSGEVIRKRKLSGNIKGKDSVASKKPLMEKNKTCSDHIISEQGIFQKEIQVKEGLRPQEKSTERSPEGLMHEDRTYEEQESSNSSLSKKNTTHNSFELSNVSDAKKTSDEVALKQKEDLEKHKRTENTKELEPNTLNVSQPLVALEKDGLTPSHDSAKAGKQDSSYIRQKVTGDSLSEKATLGNSSEKETPLKHITPLKASTDSTSGDGSDVNTVSRNRDIDELDQNNDSCNEAIGDSLSRELKLVVIDAPRKELQRLDSQLANISNDSRLTMEVLNVSDSSSDSGSESNNDESVIIPTKEESIISANNLYRNGKPPTRYMNINLTELNVLGENDQTLTEDPAARTKKFHKNLNVYAHYKLGDMQQYPKSLITDLVTSGIADHTPLGEAATVSSTNDICSSTNFDLGDMVYYYQQRHATSSLIFKTIEYNDETMLNSQRSVNIQPDSSNLTEQIKEVPSVRVKGKTQWINTWMTHLKDSVIYLCPFYPQNAVNVEKVMMHDMYAKIGRVFEEEFHAQVVTRFSGRASIIILRGELEQFTGYPMIDRLIRISAHSKRIRVWSLEKTLKFIENMGVELNQDQGHNQSKDAPSNNQEEVNSFDDVDKTKFKELEVKDNGLVSTTKADSIRADGALEKISDIKRTKFLDKIMSSVSNIVAENRTDIPNLDDGVTVNNDIKNPCSSYQEIGERQESNDLEQSEHDEKQNVERPLEFTGSQITVDKAPFMSKSTGPSDDIPSSIMRERNDNYVQSKNNSSVSVLTSPNLDRIKVDSKYKISDKIESNNSGNNLITLATEDSFESNTEGNQVKDINDILQGFVRIINQRNKEIEEANETVSNLSTKLLAKEVELISLRAVIDQYKKHGRYETPRDDII